MTDQWLPVDLMDDGPCQARASLGLDSGWFDGHFPDHPVLPGVALLALCGEAAARIAGQEGRQVRIGGFSKVKFKRMVLPDEELLISLDPNPKAPETDYTFRINCGEEIVVTGRLSLEKQ